MVSPINASKAVTDYKLPEKTTTTKFLLIGVTVVNTYHLPANRQSTRSTSSIKGPNFLECSGSFASICKAEFKKCETTYCQRAAVTVNSHLWQELEGMWGCFCKPSTPWGSRAIPQCRFPQLCNTSGRWGMKQLLNKHIYFFWPLSTTVTKPGLLTVQIIFFFHLHCWMSRNLLYINKIEKKTLNLWQNCLWPRYAFYINN